MSNPKISLPKLSVIGITIFSAIFFFFGFGEQNVDARSPDEVNNPTVVRSVSVTGEAEVKVAPDEVILTLGVETWDEDLPKARQKNETIQKKLIELTRQLNIEPKFIQTDYINVQPRIETDKYQTIITGYFVRQTVVITLKDLSKFEALLTGALESGVNYVHGVEFRTSDLRKYRDEARSLAIKAAREKAAALAGDLNQQIGEPQNITEVQNYWGGSYGSWWGGWRTAASQNVTQNSSSPVGSNFEGTLSPGLISIRAVIQVEYGLK